MFQTGQRVERDQVEQWVRDAYSFPYFKAVVVEREEPEHGRVRVTTTITGPDGQELVAINRKAVYFSMRDLTAKMPQTDDGWAT